jgi:hypothetical protein
MALTTRATGLSSPVHKGRVDFTIYCGAWAVGRIYEHLEGPEHLRWFWALNGMFGRRREIRDHGHAPNARSGQGPARSGVAAVAGMGEAGRALGRGRACVPVH